MVYSLLHVFLILLTHIIICLAGRIFQNQELLRQLQGTTWWMEAGTMISKRNWLQVVRLYKYIVAEISQHHRITLM